MDDLSTFGHFQVERRPDGSPWLLGRGAMGVTYKALDITLGSHVALKVISPGALGARGARERFLREARAAAHLNHPNVASVFHLGDSGGTVFYAMEFIEGETLEAFVQSRGSPLPVRLALAIALQAAQGLAAAHERGLIHRDIKPANLMIVRPGTRHGTDDGNEDGDETDDLRVKVIDFGLAKLLRPALPSSSSPGEHAADPALTRFQPLGTPSYMSPEQIEPESVGGAIDARADIYSLGATLWYLLTGTPPFTGTQHQVLSQHLDRELPFERLDAADVPPGVADLLGWMLAKAPADRPAGYGELISRLRRLLRATVAPAERSTTLRGSGGSGGSGGSDSSDETTLIPRRFRRTRFLSPPPPRRAWSKRVIVSAVILVAGPLLLALGGWAAWRGLSGGRRAGVSSPPAGDRSIAVLPFENLSEDKENAFFADGIQDDVITSLAKIKDLRVISRSSADAFRRHLTTAGERGGIGEALGVSYVLEGSVRRAANRVLVNVHLFDARRSRQVWTERYDRTLADSLTLQGELATEIAAALRANLSPEEKARVEAKPTENADAYVLYLRAREHEIRPGYLITNYQTAVALYEQAIALDPGFAVAYAHLGAVLTYLYQNDTPTPELKTRARQASDEALRLRPDLGEGHLARAYYLYRIERDYAGALRASEAAARLLPNDGDVSATVAYIHRRQGRWRDTLAGLERALARDPRNVQVAEEVFVTLTKLRDWPAARRAGDRAVALAPEAPTLPLKLRFVDVWAHDDFAPLRAALAAVPPGVDPDGYATLARWDAALLQRDFAAAERAASFSSAPDGSTNATTVLSNLGTPLPTAYLLGSVALARGDEAGARTLFEAARPAMEADVQAVPQSAFRRGQLGLLYAYLGRREDALREGRRAVALTPESADAADGPSATGLLAVILARVGETDEALALVERLLTTPAAPLEFFEGSVTQADLRRRWQWDPLRGDPRFQRLLAGPEPKTVHR